MNDAICRFIHVHSGAEALMVVLFSVRRVNKDNLRGDEQIPLKRLAQSTGSRHTSLR